MSMTRLSCTLVSALAVAGAMPALAANIIPAHVTTATVNGTDGVLRAGSIWDPPVSASDENSVFNDAFRPEGSVWTDGSFWWDDDSTVNASPVSLELQLDSTYTLDSFVIQADDNDSYQVEFWDGAVWQPLWTVPAVFTFGLVTRATGPVAPITTDRFRFSAVSGDNYYAISEFQAFEVDAPEPASMALFGAGLAGLTLMKRRRQNPA